MCLAVPFKIEKIEDKVGVCEFDGARRKVRLDFVPKAKVNDYVIVHAGFAIEIVKEDEAIEARKDFKDVMDNA